MPTGPWDKQVSEYENLVKRDLAARQQQAAAPYEARVQQWTDQANATAERKKQEQAAQAADQNSKRNKHPSPRP
jgi:hypothetical protein